LCYIHFDLFFMGVGNRLILFILFVISCWLRDRGAELFGWLSGVNICSWYWLRRSVKGFYLEDFAVFDPRGDVVT